MANGHVETWVEAQVQQIDAAMKRDPKNRFGSFRLAPDWGDPAERAHAFKLVSDRLTALGYHVEQRGPALRVTRP